jgi:RNA polymerase sigma-70 factor (ECF subfamily)
MAGAAPTRYHFYALNDLPGTLATGGVPFSATHWTVVFLSAKTGPAHEAETEDALASLCRVYWPPLYTFVRRRGYARADAQDLTQDFFIHLLETDALAKVDPKRGRFRTFLLAALKNFLASAHERSRALKRGGGQEFLPLDDVIAEAEAAVQLDGGEKRNASGEEDVLFEQRWAAALVTRALEQLRMQLIAEGKERLYDELQVFVTGAGRCQTRPRRPLGSESRLRLCARTFAACGNVTAMCCAQKSHAPWRRRPKWTTNCVTSAKC